MSCLVCNFYYLFILYFEQFLLTCIPYSLIFASALSDMLLNSTINFLFLDVLFFLKYDMSLFVISSSLLNFSNLAFSFSDIGNTAVLFFVFDNSNIYILFELLSFICCVCWFSFMLSPSVPCYLIVLCTLYLENYS